MKFRFLILMSTVYVLQVIYGVSFADEEIFASQQELLIKQIDSLHPGRDGVTDMYFIGFAPYASEDVFMNEATYVRNLFDLQYDTLHRSILLVNNSKTLGVYPVANLQNLEKAFAKIGSLINPREDIVVLYITSHGKKDLGISLKFDNAGNLGPEREYLDSVTLRNMFDENNIQWKVLFILACFSGGLIEKLMDENTVIITSASKEKPSFGCGHHGDFTQFGEVMFHEKLSKTRNFVTAFDPARKRVEELEKSMGLIPSQPQIFLGKKIEPLLEQVIQ